MLIDTNVLSGLIAEAVKTGTIAAYEEMGLHTPDVKSDKETMSTQRKEANTDSEEETEEAKKDAKNEKRRKAAAEKKAVKEEKEANAKAQAAEEAKAKANSEKGDDLDDDLDADLDGDLDADSDEEEMTKEEFIKAVKIKYEGKFPVAKALMKKMFGSKYKNFSVMDDAADFKKFLAA